MTTTKDQIPDIRVVERYRLRGDSIVQESGRMRRPFATCPEMPPVIVERTSDMELRVAGTRIPVCSVASFREHGIGPEHVARVNPGTTADIIRRVYLWLEVGGNELLYDWMESVTGGNDDDSARN